MSSPLRLIALSCVLSSGLFAQPNLLPFDKGVRIDVVAAKPAKVGGGDFDDKTQNIALKLKFTNIDTRQGYDGCKATVSVLGQSTIDRNVRMVMMQEEVPLAQLAPRQAVEHTTKTVSTKFDKTGAIFGFTYDGWMIVVKDATGKIVQVKSTAPTLEKAPEKVEKLTEGTCFGKNLESTDNPDGRRNPPTVKIKETTAQ
jgi:hypothetical protein